MPVVDLSVVVVNYNTAHLLPRMLAALEVSKRSLSLQVIVVDNCSRDDSVEILRRDFPDVHLIANPANVGFARANNQALPWVIGRHVLLLNADAFVAPDTLVKTVTYMDAHPACGILGVRLVGQDGVLQPSCRYAPTVWNVFLARSGMRRLFPRARMVDDMTWDHASVRECDWVPGCYYLVRGEVIAEIGLFDPRFFLYYEEVDHCLIAQHAGWKIVYYPHTSVVHIGGESAKSDGEMTVSDKRIKALHIESELIHFRKHYGLAGAVASLALSSLADALLAVRWILGGRGFRELDTLWTDCATHWRLATRTHLGARPTR